MEGPLSQDAPSMAQSDLSSWRTELAPSCLHKPLTKLPRELWKQHRLLSLQVLQALLPCLLAQGRQARLLLLLAPHVVSHLRTEGLCRSRRRLGARRHSVLRAGNLAPCKQWATISTDRTSTAPRDSTKNLLCSR